MSKATLTINGEPWLDKDFTATEIPGQFVQSKVVGDDEKLHAWGTVRDGELVLAVTSTRIAKPGGFVGPETREIHIVSESLGIDEKHVDTDVWPGCFTTWRHGSLGLVPKDEEHARHWEWNEQYLDGLPDETPDDVRAALAEDIADEAGRNYIDTNPKTTQQGSPRRVWFDFLPCVAAKLGIPFDYSRLERWTDRQGAWRALHWGASPYDFTYEEWPYQRKVLVDGKEIPCSAFDRQHFELTKILAHYILTGDPVARYTLIKHGDALISQIFRGEFDNEDNLRAIGECLDALAMLGSWWPDFVGKANALLARAPLDERFAPVPWAVVNEAARERHDHGYCGISTWMHGTIALGSYRLDSLGNDAEELTDICAANLDHARMVSKEGLGTFPDDFDVGKVFLIEDKNGETHPFGSGSTNFSPYVMYWLFRENRPDREKHVLSFYEKADACRVSDKNRQWPLILRVGPAYGYR